MSFLDLTLKPEYRSRLDDVVNDFYTPVLNEAVMYKRAVGFFFLICSVRNCTWYQGIIKE